MAVRPSVANLKLIQGGKTGSEISLPVIFSAAIVVGVIAYVIFKNAEVKDAP